MKGIGTVLAVAVLLAVPAFAGKFVNGGFETDFGSRENMNVWGEYGDAWGEAYQVNAGQGNHPKKARTGERVLLINVPPNSWDGTWQQLPWAENAPFSWEASYLIQGGNLPESCATFMKAEFYDGNDNLLEVKEGDRHRADTRGQWVHDSMRGTTPAGTAAIRFILIAGNNTESATIADRIYWDDADTEE
jgi:hypothetical protein